MSLKNIVFNVLEKAIGDFIVGFTSDHLKLGLWSGKISLNDLKINVEAVKKLGLPLGIVGGSVESLELEIPWSRLGSSPVKIYVEGVFLVVTEEGSPAQIDPDGVKDKLAALVRARLEAADEAFKLQLEAGGGAGKTSGVNDGMAARYVSKIVDNIEIGLSRVHVRFEGSGDLPAVGITLSSFRAHAVNEAWEKAFVERDASRQGAAVVRNLAELKGLSVYCQLDKHFDESDPFEQVIESLDSMIALAGENEQQQLLDKSYVLRPVDASLRITRNDKDKQGLPRYRLEFQTGKDNAHLAIKSNVVAKVVSLGKRVDLLKRQRAATKYHPAATMGSAARPIKRGINAKLWWRYAAEFVCPNLASANRGRSAFDASTLRRLRSRPRYLELYTASLDKEDYENNSSQDGLPPQFSEEEDEEMKRIEGNLPIDALVVWRQQILLERHEERAAVAESQQPGFFGRVFGRGGGDGKTSALPKHDKSDDASLDDLRAIARRAEEEEARAAPPPEFELVRAVVRTGCRISLCDDRDNVLTEFGVELSAFARRTANGDETDIVAGLGDLYMRDSSGLAARSGILDEQRNILCHEENDKSNDPFESSLVAIEDRFPELSRDDDARDAVNGGVAPVQLLVSMRPLEVSGKGQPGKRTDVVARSRPFRVSYHAPTIARLLDVFRPPPDDQEKLTKASAEKAEDARKAAAEALDILRETDGDEDEHQRKKPLISEADLVYGFVIDAKFGAPTIYLPRSWHQAEGAFVVDTGAVVIYGGIDALQSRRQSWSVKVKEANITRVDSSNKVCGNVVAPCGISVFALLTGPEDANPPLALDIVGTPVSLLLARSTLRELLELAALLAQGLNADADKDQPQPIMLDEPEEIIGDDESAQIVAVAKNDESSQTAKTELATGQQDAVKEQKTKKGLSSSAARAIAFKLTAKFPLLELKVWSNAELAYVAKISTLKIDFKVRSVGGMMLKSTLESIALDDERAQFSIIESFGSSDAVETTKAALTARDQLSLRSSDVNDDLFTNDDDKALFSFSMVTDPNAPPSGEDEDFYATRIAISFCTLRAKCGAGTLLPLEPLMSELFQGLRAFSGGGDSRSKNEPAEASRVVEQEEVASPPAGMHVVATIGEISAVLLDKSGKAAVASASVVGTAVLFSSQRTGMRNVGVRISAFALEDARPIDDSLALTRLIAPKRSVETSDDMLIVADYSDDGRHMNVSALLRPLSFCVLPDVLYASLASVNALLGSLAAILSPRTEDEKAREEALAEETKTMMGEQTTMQSPASTDKPRLITIDVRMPEIEAVLARDASNRHSEALLLRVGADASMKSETYGNRQGGEMAVKASMRDLSLLLAENGALGDESASNPFHILDPVEADMSFERRVDGDGDPYNTVVSANLTELALRLSYSDILSIAAMVGTLRAVEEKQVHADEPTPSTTKQRTFLDDSSPTEITKVATVAGSLAFSGARVVVVDDSLGPAVPILNLAIGKLDAKIDGPTTNLVGNGSCSIAATSYNHECLSYEPLIREFDVKATVEITKDFDTGVTSKDFVVSTDQIVEVLISHTLVTDVLHLSSRLRSEAPQAFQSSRTKETVKTSRDDPPLFVANETELSLRCRADGPWIDLGPGRRVPVEMTNTSRKSIETSSLLQAPAAVDITNNPRDRATSDFLLSGLVSNAPYRGVKEVDVIDPMLSNGITWHVGFDETSGRVLATFMSRVLISNRTPIPVAIASVEDLDNEAVTVVEPLSKKRAPLGLAQRGVMLKIRRKDDEKKDQSWQWSERSTALFVWEHEHPEEDSTSTRSTMFSARPSGATSAYSSARHSKVAVGKGASLKRLVTCAGQKAHAPTQHIIYGIQRVPPPTPGAEEAKIILAPPILVRSRLPCGVVLTLASASSETRFRVEPGADVGCCDLQVKNGIYLACRIASFGGKCESKLTTKKAAKKAPPGTGNNYTSDFSGSTPGLYELILRRDGTELTEGTGNGAGERGDNSDNVLTLELRVEKTHRSLGLQITLSCPLWILDKTRLRLGFALTPPKVMDRLSSTLFGSNKSSSISNSTSVRPVETRQRVPSALLANKVGIWIDSQRPHTLKKSPNTGDPLYAEGDSVPYFFDNALTEPLASAVRLVTHDAERSGPTNQPAIFKNFTQQHQQRMRRVGLESDAAKARRQAPYITIRNDDQSRLLDVYVAVDGRVERTPEWMLDCGLFTRATQTSAVKVRKKARPLAPSSFFKSDDDVRDYIVWQAAVKPGGGFVDLFPNEDKAMYLVFLSLRKAASTSLDNDEDEDDEARPSLVAASQNDIVAGDWLDAWPGSDWLGKFGSSLLSSPDGKKFAINRQGRKSDGWSSLLAAAAASSFTTSMDDGNGGTLELDVIGSPLRGVFSNFGTLVDIAPRYALWNIDVDYNLCARQTGSRGADAIRRFEAGQKNAVPWHWPDSKLDSKIQFGVATENSGEVVWALAPISIESIGGFSLLTTEEGVVIRIEVSVNTDYALPPYAGVLVYMSVDRQETALFAARNDASTGVDAVFMQGQRLLARVPPGEKRVIGWAKPTNLESVDVMLDRKTRTSVDIDAVLAETPLAKSNGLTVAVHVKEGTRFFDVGPKGQLEEPQEESGDVETQRSISLRFAGLGLSVVGRDASKVRRELMYCRITKTEAVFCARGKTEEFQLNVGNVQLDNHTPKALWPTFVATSQREEEDADIDLVSVAAVKARHKDGSSSLRYFAARILPIDVHADLASIMTLGSAVGSLPLDILNAEEALASQNPAQWTKSLTNHRDIYGVDGDVEKARRTALGMRGYIETLMLHPVEVTISFEPTAVEQDDVNLSVLSYVRTLATITNASVRLNSFIVERAVETTSNLVTRLRFHYVMQILSQLLYIVGSFASIGSPANLVDSVGGGVKEFFYAPAKGIVESPSAFGTGVAKGTAGLVGGVVGGVSSSVAGIGNAVGTNLSMLSGDNEYMAERDARRRKFNAENGGAGAGVVAGGTSIARGFAEGIGGIFYQPYQGAQKGGVLGGVKGFAKGIAGVAVKPVVGVLDGVGTVLQGVSQTASNATVVQHVRPTLKLRQIPDSDQDVIDSSYFSRRA